MGRRFGCVDASNAARRRSRRAKETSSLLETSLALTNLDLKAILQDIGNSAKNLFSADHCRLFLMRPDGETLRCVLALQESPSAFLSLVIRLGEGVTGSVAASGRAEIVNEMRSDPRAVQVPGTLEEEEALMFAPLKERDRTIGVISIRRTGSDRPFQPSDLSFLEAFASMAASAVSNARLFEETQRLFILLGLLISRGIQIAINAQDAFRRYLAAGIIALLAAQSILIIGGNLRLFPLTGVTLPFISYGGTSLLTSFLGLAILLHISNHEKRAVKEANAIPQATGVSLHSRYYLHMGGILLAALSALAITHGWWAIYRGANLLTRTDNPRRAIGDRYVRRGALLDRHNEPISTTTGQSGELTRQYSYTDLGPIVGYTHPVYGQSGLEASLDEKANQRLCWEPV